MWQNARKFRNNSNFYVPILSFYYNIFFHFICIDNNIQKYAIVLKNVVSFDLGMPESVNPSSIFCFITFPSYACHINCDWYLNSINVTFLLLFMFYKTFPN